MMPVGITWRPPGWSHDSTVQVALSGGSRSTTVRFHQERLANSTERERQRDHWRAVLDRLTRGNALRHDDPAPPAQRR